MSSSITIITTNTIRTLFMIWTVVKMYSSRSYVIHSEITKRVITISWDTILSHCSRFSKKSMAYMTNLDCQNSRN